MGSDADWDRAEKALADALDAQKLPWEELPGEGAFYGPKIEFSPQGLHRPGVAAGHHAGGFLHARAGWMPSTWPKTAPGRCR